MATQTVEFRAATGLTLTAKLFAAANDTEVASVSATEATNRKGTYSAAYTDVAAGEYQLIALDGTTPVASWWVTLTLTTATFGVYDKADTRDIVADTQDIQSRLPAALVSGRMDASVGAMQANTLSASVLATDAVEEIADGVWDEPYAGHTTAGSFGKIMDLLRKANLTIDGTVSSAITPTTLTFSSNVSATTSAYAHAVLLFVSGPLAGENSPIVSYTSTNGVFVLEEPLTAAPSDGDEFVVIAGSHVHAIADIQSGLSTSAGVTAAFTEIKGAGWSSATDTLEEIRDAVDAGGGGGVTVAPLQATAPNRVAGTEIVTYINDTSDIGPIVVTDGDGDAVDLSSYTLKVCIERKESNTIDANITPTVSGAGSNQVTFTPTSACVDSTTPRKWSLRSTSNGQVFAFGDFKVEWPARLS